MQEDPLYAYLTTDVLPQTDAWCPEPRYAVSRLSGSNNVFLYTEENSGLKIIGKFFLPEGAVDDGTAVDRLEKEYDALTTMRGYGFDQPPFYIAKPYGKNPDMNALLTVEFCEGELLSNFMERSAENDDSDALFDGLTRLARFFAFFHNTTAQTEPVDFEKTVAYTQKLVRQCALLLSATESADFLALTDMWAQRGCMSADNAVYVHGDATPNNFMIDENGNVITFDMERFMQADRLFDIGRMAAELKHFFWLQTGDKDAGEPFIGHFLWEYACCFPDRDAAFAAVTERLPFYMGINLMRIARNWWLNREIRLRLAQEAFHCLKEE